MKNNLLKKTIALSLTVAMAMGTLVGCGGSGDAAATSKTDSTSATSTVTTTSTGDKHLNFGCYVYSTDYDPAAYQNAAWDGLRHGVTRVSVQVQR